MCRSYMRRLRYEGFPTGFAGWRVKSTGRYMQQDTAVISETGMGGVPNGRNLMEQLLAEPETNVRTLKYGDVLEGIVMQLDRDEVLVDIGSKSEGIIPNKELSSLSDEERKGLGTGDTVLVFVVQPENADGHAV